ncbi:acyl-CoA dehydrogenase [Desulfosarcina ovata subsp. sediminis]|uniref:Acyl-CoA dehydrogenase n=1 Tax=Desulfosarcina ovata subsp. sediminis TaxID=885957 RepID=A0A5K7ZI00_9BACT|nr:acyl-CoA dehydrogenase [Desulfosarcina ovata]BBO80974.1 acyl-CoA dehydrogenase [Desulfosarcina ovata subsp. sediminis]
MAQVIADKRDVDFVLHEQLHVDALSQHPEFAEFNRKVVDMIVTEARGLAVKEMLPTLRPGDEEGCVFDQGAVHTPASFKRAWRLLQDGEWLAPARDPRWGGQGMPETVAMATREYLSGGNMALFLCAALTHGAAHLIEIFGSESQKQTYLEKMYQGRWSGTMLLTEPDAGSDLGALTTSAVKNDDGSYSISGNKIFISSGEQDLTENIIHPVLARIDGAPAGSRGVSLFLVPKYHVNPDGSLGERNDVFCTGIEHKMGINGSPTCSMALGGKGRCIGTLLGQENRGLAAMFVMMNEERLMCGWQSLANASSAYLHALDYARTRVQSALPGGDGKPVAIINHADVRRMLLNMKTYVDGMRSLLYFIAYCEDRKRISTGDEEHYQHLIDILIPVAKGYVSDRAVDVCNTGVQVFGGYGYTREYPMEQLLRDVRICGIYEGTNGIQALDLMTRKITLDDGALFAELSEEIRKTIAMARETSRSAFLAERLDACLNDLADSVSQIRERLTRPDERLRVMVAASPFLEATGDLVMGWMLLWRATLAERALATGARKKDAAFYTGQILAAEHFTETAMAMITTRLQVIRESRGIALDIPEDAFGGK